MPSPDKAAARPYVLGIETSCDETSAAVVRGWRQILANVVVSQDVHSDWGGVVPELASREHLRATLPAVRRAMKTAGLSWDDLDGIAVTRGPGLVGALLVGLSMAKALAFGLDLPLVGVNHLEGHLFSLLLEDPEWRPPYLALIVSGGHTELHMVEELGVYKRLGGTVDDAAGEAFDKVGVLLGLDYPAGARLDALAEMAGPSELRFPIASVDAPGHNFSFSGLKTAVLNRWQKIPESDRDQLRQPVAAAFRKAVVDALLQGVIGALEETRAPRIAVAGGVASNRLLRREITALAVERGLEVAFPSPRLCTDNAAMIAAAGAYHLARGQRDDLTIDANPALPLTSFRQGRSHDDPPGGRA
jgi:N6-L-threonylcarbamoyladenine synthase